MYYRIAELRRGAALDRARRRARRLRARHQGVPARREDARGGRAPRRQHRRRLGAARQRLRRRARPPQRQGRADRRSASASRASSRRSSATSRRPRRRTATCSASSRSTPRRSTNLDRIYTAIEQYPELAADARAARARRTTEPLRAGRAPRPPRPNLRGAARRARRRDPRLPPRLRRARARPTSSPILALERIYEQKGAWTDLKVVLERELENAGGDTQEADIRAKMAHLARGSASTTSPAPSRRGSASSSCAARIRRRSRALADLYERVEQWAELCDVLERHYDIAVRRRDARRGAAPPRQALQRAARPRRRGARRLQPRARHRLRERRRRSTRIADIWRTPQRSAGARRPRCTRRWIAPPPRSRPRTSSRSSASSARSTSRRSNQPYDAIDAWRKLLEVDPRDFEAMAALENLLRAEERWAEVIDVKMRRAEAYEEPQEKIREYLEVAAIWENQVGDKDKGDARLREDPRASTRRTTRRSSRWRSSTAPRAAASRSSSSTSRASRRARRSSERDDILPQGRQGLRGAARRQAAGVRRPGHRLRDGLRRHGRRPLPRAHGAGHEPLAASSSRPSTRWLQAADGSAPEDHALPAPRQVVRARTSGTPSTRSRTTSRSSSSTRTTSPVLRQMASFYRRSGPVAAAGRRRSRARSTSPSPTSIARRSSPSSARCSSGR